MTDRRGLATEEVSIRLVTKLQIFLFRHFFHSKQQRPK